MPGRTIGRRATSNMCSSPGSPVRVRSGVSFNDRAVIVRKRVAVSHRDAAEYLRIGGEEVRAEAVGVGQNLRAPPVVMIVRLSAAATAATSLLSIAVVKNRRKNAAPVSLAPAARVPGGEARGRLSLPALASLKAVKNPF